MVLVCILDAGKYRILCKVIMSFKSISISVLSNVSHTTGIFIHNYILLLYLMYKILISAVGVGIDIGGCPTHSHIINLTKEHF